MAHPILMPKPGQMTEECVLTLWLKEAGDPVHRGDVLFEIETDKSSMEVETFDEGVLLAKLVQDGETAPVNAVCGWIGQAGEAVAQICRRPHQRREIGGGKGGVAIAQQFACVARLPGTQICACLLRLDRRLRKRQRRFIAVVHFAVE